jgi:flagellar basal body-associated protein FliL
MAETKKVEGKPADDRKKRILIYAIVIISVFLLGLVPMGIVAYNRASERDEARRELRLCSIQAMLASAAVDARMGNYEPARQSASNFFTELRTELDKGRVSAFNQSQRDGMASMLNSRDEVITLLARNDPASADRLGALFIAYKRAVGNTAEQK